MRTSSDAVTVRGFARRGRPRRPRISGSRRRGRRSSHDPPTARSASRTSPGRGRSGTVLSTKNPESRDHVLFLTLPDGIVIGDAEEAARGNGAHTRRLSRDGGVAVIVVKEPDGDTFRFDVYDLSGRTGYTALLP